MDVTGLTEKQIQKKVESAYFMFLEIEKILCKTCEPKQAKCKAQLLMKDIIDADNNNKSLTEFIEEEMKK